MASFNKTAIVLLSLTLLAIFAGAETMTGNFEISYFQDAPVERTMIFTNTGSTAMDFSLDIVGDKTSWTFVSQTKETIQGFCASSKDIVLCTAPSEFSLAAGAQREIYFFSKAKTYAKPGLYYIDSLSKGTKIGTFAITVQQGHTLDLALDNTVLSAGQCEPKTINLTVQNTGRFDEEITITSSGVPTEWVSAEEKSFILNQGATKNTAINIQAPCNQELKNYELEIIAAIPRADYQTAQKVSFSIENKQGFAIADLDIANNTIEACKEQTTKQAVKITNNGRLADSIELSIKAPEFVALSEKTVSIEPGKTATVYLTANKTNAENKKYSIELTAKSTKFGNSATKTLSLNLKDCYNATITKTSGKEKACLTEKINYTFTINNARDTTTSYSLKVSGIKAILSKETVKLEAAQSDTVNAALDFSNETVGKKEISLTASNEYYSTTSKFGIELVNCAIDIAPEKSKVDVNVSVGTLTRIIVTNNALTTENITLSVRGKDWILFQPKEFSLNAGEKKDVYMYVSPPSYTEDSVQSINISAKSDNYSANKSIDLNVFGGMQFGKADVIVNDLLIKEIGSIKEITLTVNLKNDSNVSVTVQDINVSGFEASYSMRDRKIAPTNSKPFELKIRLAKGSDENKFSVPIKIITEQGNFDRIIAIDLSPKASDSNASQGQTIGIGLATFSQPRNLLIVGIIIILVALIGYLAFKGSDKEETVGAETKTHTGMEEIVDEVEKKKTKKPKKKK